MDRRPDDRLQRLADAWHNGLSPGDGMGLLWHLALRRYPSAMTELGRRIGEDGLSAADPFSAAGLLIELCGKVIRWRRTTSRCRASIAVICAVTDIGYVSRRTLGMKMLASNFAGSRPGFLTEQLATSSAVVHGGPMIERPNVG